MLNRPYAFAQWINKAKIAEKFILMSEPDHIFIRPLPNFMTGAAAAGASWRYVAVAVCWQALLRAAMQGWLPEHMIASTQTPCSTQQPAPLIQLVTPMPPSPPPTTSHLLPQATHQCHTITLPSTHTHPPTHLTAAGDTPAAFPFFYIEPSTPENAPVTQKFTGQLTRKELDSIAPIGNSPTYMTVEDMKKVMPIWMNMSIAVFTDKEASGVSAAGWHLGDGAWIHVVFFGG